MLVHSTTSDPEIVMNVPNLEVVIFVFGPAITEKTTFSARLYNPNWIPPRVPYNGCRKQSKITYGGVSCTIVDTPGFDYDITYHYGNYQAVESMLKNCVERTRRTYSNTKVAVQFSAIYCYPMATGQIGTDTRRDLQALVALCKLFDFDTFTVVPVGSLGMSTEQRQLTTQKVYEHPQIKEIQANAGEISSPDPHPDRVLDHILSKAAHFNILREGVSWAARMAYAKAQLQSQPTNHPRPQESEMKQLKSRLKQSEDFSNSLLRSLALPAYNLELKTLAKDFSNLNRDISKIVKSITRHCKGERNIGVSKLLTEPVQLDSMHKLLSRGHDNCSPASLYQNNSSRQMSVKFFLQSAMALLVCGTLHERVFQPFYPGLELGTDNVLMQTYESVCSKNNDTMSGKWRHDTFIGLHQAVERHQELHEAISRSIKESILQLLQVIYADVEALSAQQQAALSDLDPPFAPFDALVQQAFELNYKIKAEAVLLGNFSTLYYPPGEIFDPRTMVVDGADEEQGDEETQKGEGTGKDEHTIFSTFGLGLMMERNNQTNATERDRELILINSAVVTDESSCDVTY